jgi:hypothetical protein
MEAAVAEGEDAAAVIADFATVKAVVAESGGGHQVP